MSLVDDLKTVRRHIPTMHDYRQFMSIPKAIATALPDGPPIRHRRVLMALEASHDGGRLNSHKAIIGLFRRAITAASDGQSN